MYNISKYFKVFLCISFIYLFHGFSASSQSDSLGKYIRIAVERNPAVQQKFVEYRAAMQKIPQAAALPDPEFNISYFLMPMELVSGKQIAEMNIMQMFPWFGVLGNAKDEMTNMAYAGFEEYREAGLQVALDVQITWYDLYRVRNTAGLTRKSLDILKAIEDISLTRYKSSPSGSSVQSTATVTQNQVSSGTAGSQGSAMQGMNGTSGGQVSQGTRQQPMPMNNSQMGETSSPGLADLYRLKMEAADLENNLQDLEEQENILSQRLNILMNREPSLAVFVPDSLAAETFSVDSADFSGPHSGNPMLGMIKYEKNAYAAREKMTRRMGLPMIGLGIGYSVIGKNDMTAGEMPESMGGKDMIMPMVSISIPVWRKKYRAMRLEAELLSEASVQRYESVSDNLRLEHNDALSSYRDALRRKELYNGQKNLAASTLSLLQTRLAVSSANLTDILRVQQQLLGYEIREVEAEADLRKSVAVLKRIMAFSIDEINLKNKE